MHRPICIRWHLNLGVLMVLIRHLAPCDDDHDDDDKKVKNVSNDDN